ncbi:MAG: adenylosuccinate lyase [Actinomycetia bacterium]|nr:adenylosuccinate lyase [Actinomycetes bacterium]
MIRRYTREVMGRLWTDEERYRRWLEVELLAVEAWEREGRFPPGTASRLRERARVDVARIAALEAEFRHDVIAFVTAVAETVDPDDARALHFGLTSTDVVDTALSWTLVDALDLIAQDLAELRAVLRDLALRHRHTPVMGRTHGMHAEPTSFGLKMALFWLEFGRHEERLRAARQRIAVGKLSGAVGHYANLPPAIEAYVTRRLGLEPAPLSTQVLQRDRHAEVVLTLALIGSTVDKVATEIRHLQRTEVGEVEEPFAAGQRGSSAMPHKRNPVASEQLSGLARVLRGMAVPALEDMVLWHERDISHSSVERIMLPDATILVDYMLAGLTRILKGLVVRPDRMRANIDRAGGIAFSQNVLLALVDRGLSRDAAYRLVQAAAMETLADPSRSFRERLWENETVRGLLDPDAFERLFAWEPYLRYVDTIYERIGLGGDPAASRGASPHGKE